jgi:hypothetical protein
MKQLEKDIIDHLKEAPVVRQHLAVLDWKMNWAMGLISATFVATLGALLVAMLRK